MSVRTWSAKALSHQGVRSPPFKSTPARFHRYFARRAFPACEPRRTLKSPDGVRRRRSERARLASRRSANIPCCCVILRVSSSPLGRANSHGPPTVIMVGRLIAASCRSRTFNTFFVAKDATQPVFRPAFLVCPGAASLTLAAALPRRSEPAGDANVGFSPRLIAHMVPPQLGRFFRFSPKDLPWL